MIKKVIFKLKVASTLDDVEVYGNNERLTVTNGKGEVNAFFIPGG